MWATLLQPLFYSAAGQTFPTFATRVVDIADQPVGGQLNLNNDVSFVHPNEADFLFLVVCGVVFGHIVNDNFFSSGFDFEGHSGPYLL
jgi:hypothetical protein